ncbi:MAG: ATP-binding protein [Cyclobacteriaceae bacterium]|nr:ATP-binding protein [Cyclobacteriaceae bacterium]MCH8516760.1 ATP-binding protein [Cyclobacteriaceae bacterium]
MRYLNKIIFINSAANSIPYAEVYLDGNVHFIGTQGVGKSTLLRAILFFYNADTQKLGIPREKKNYNDYYFPGPNSYIVYEVSTEKGKYCVMSFKSQARAAFRFIDAPYEKSFFISDENIAYGSWDQIRQAIGTKGYTRMVNNYEEYRNILYGNNKGLSAEFRKYALITSKQYQNIPRTISNVFLNAKLDAEFVKQTIIKSLNEEEVSIDLSTYSQTHLRDFESNLNDIRQWTDGQALQQANKVSETYTALRFSEQNKNELAFQLGYAYQGLQEQQPQLAEALKEREEHLAKVQHKLSDLDAGFEKKRVEIERKIGEVNANLRRLQMKKTAYEALPISDLLERVAKKPVWELEKKNLIEEKLLLTNQYLAIKDRYEALIRQLDNQLSEYMNLQNEEKNTLNSRFYNGKEALSLQYEEIIEKLRKQHKDQIEEARIRVAGAKEAIAQQKIRKEQIRHQSFFREEMDAARTALIQAVNRMQELENSSEKAKVRIKALQREWDFEAMKNEAEHAAGLKQEEALQAKLDKRIASIDDKINNSKHALYGWLNSEVPNWEHTIGKVIDEDGVLFSQDLNPQLTQDSSNSFYGIQLDLDAIPKKVKTVADLKTEILDLRRRLDVSKSEAAQWNVWLREATDKLKKRFQPKIKTEKDLIQKNEYSLSNQSAKKEALQVKLLELEEKAKEESKKAIALIDKLILNQSDQLQEATQILQTLEEKLELSIQRKRKEKQERIKEQQDEIALIFKEIDARIQAERSRIAKKTEEIKKEQEQKLSASGADTKKIDTIDQRLAKIDGALNYIEENRDKVAEYQQDKRELFDKEGEFRNNRQLLNRQLELAKGKYQQLQQKLIDEKQEQRAIIDQLHKKQQEMLLDITSFQQFEQSEIYLSVADILLKAKAEHKTDRNCRELIQELYTAENTLMRRSNALQLAINNFTGNFEEDNIFSFKLKFVKQSEYHEFAEMLEEFVVENKIEEYKQRVEERFAHITRQIARETNALIEKEGEISKVIHDINQDFVSRQFVSAIKSVELKTIESKNRVFTLLIDIKNFHDEHAMNLGAPTLFSSDGISENNEKAVKLLKQLIKEMNTYKEREVKLSDSFELLFKIEENDNSTGWVERLTNVGSEGTDILIKAMINIMLLNVFKEKANRNKDNDFRLHCMMDEMGKLHTNNVKGILKFANDRNILLVNSSPNPMNATDYKYTYLLAKDLKNKTGIKRLVKKLG